MPAKTNFEVSVDGETAIPMSGRKEMEQYARAAMQSGDTVTIYRDGIVDREQTAKYNKRANDAFRSSMFVQLTRRSYQLSSLTKEWNGGQMTEHELATELDEIISNLTELYNKTAERAGDNIDVFEEAKVSQTV